MKVKVALTGASGNMGREALRQLLELEDVEFVRILVLKGVKDRAFAAAAVKEYGKRVQVVEGDLAVKDDCRAVVDGVDYVFHIGAIIPPLFTERISVATAKNSRIEHFVLMKYASEL